jgi:hypothetical protein
MKARLLPIAAALLVAAAGGSAPARGQSHAGHGAAPAAPGRAGAHHHGRDSRGGRRAAGLALRPASRRPGGGRQVYVDFKCYACHAIKGEQFRSSRARRPWRVPTSRAWGGIIRRSTSSNPS